MTEKADTEYREEWEVRKCETFWERLHSCLAEMLVNTLKHRWIIGLDDFWSQGLKMIWFDRVQYSCWGRMDIIWTYAVFRFFSISVSVASIYWIRVFKAFSIWRRIFFFRNPIFPNSVRPCHNWFNRSLLSWQYHLLMQIVPLVKTKYFWTRLLFYSYIYS